MGLVLALPALACLLSLWVNSWFTSAPSYLETPIVVGIIFGGLATLITAPLQVFYAIRVRRRVGAGVRAWLYLLAVPGLVVFYLVGRYFVGLNNMTWL
jgi:hypothetical protein